MLALLSSAPLTIADGHHRYETALTYRADRRGRPRTEADPAWDYLLALIYPLDQAPPALPTHRVIRGQPCGEELLERLAPTPPSSRCPTRRALLARMASRPRFAPGATGTGRIGLLHARPGGRHPHGRSRRDRCAPARPASRRPPEGLDVNALTAIIERAYGDDATTMAADGRLWYVKDACVAIEQVVDEEASAAFLLDGMPPAAISAVAEAGEVMPQKSTYFNPKAPTGLLFSPLEW